MENNRKSFLVYFDWIENCQFLSNEDFGQLMRIITIYAKTGHADISELPDAAILAFNFMRGQLDRDREKYEAKCQVNRKNGAKGGRSSKNQPPATESYQQQATEQSNTNQPPASYLSPEERREAEQIMRAGKERLATEQRNRKPPTQINDAI